MVINYYCRLSIAFIYFRAHVVSVSFLYSLVYSQIMGVPAFFRWLSRKYPSIVVHANEEKVRKLIC